MDLMWREEKESENLLSMSLKQLVDDGAVLVDGKR